MSDRESTDPAELVGEWVNVWSGPSDEWTGTRMAVLAEIDVDVQETIERLHEDDSVLSYSFRVQHDDARMDLVWFGKGEMAILPRMDWRERRSLPP